MDLVDAFASFEFARQARDAAVGGIGDFGEEKRNIEPQLVTHDAILFCWLTGFSWRTGTRGLLVIEESYRLEKLGQGVEVTHRLECAGLFSWLGYPILRRFCSVFLKRSNMAPEPQLRRTTVQSRYARRPLGRA